MGIGYYTNLIYGVELQNEDAEKLDILFRSKTNLEKDEPLEMVLYELKLNDIVLAGDGAMGDLHDVNGFVSDDNYGSEIDSYYVGFDLGEHNSIEIVRKGVTQKMKDKWEEVLPYLKEAGINFKEPDLHFYKNSG